MFKCGKCHKTTQPGESMRMLVIETRDKTYYDDYGREVGRGSEIVKEVGICEACAKSK